MYNNFDTKAEIFSQNSHVNLLDKLGTHQQQTDDNTNNNQENMQNMNAMQADENQRMYTTLLQNQVLGVKNPHLIQGGYLNDEFMDSVGSIEKSIPLTLAPPSSYNVLKFAQPQSVVRQPLSQQKAFSISPFGGFEEDDLLSAPYKQQRKIPKVPFKVLDAPAL